jgi:NitT/TauT family transport system substrate-binding protein
MNGLRRWLGAAAVLAATIASSAEAPAQTAVRFMLDGPALGRHAAWYVALEKGYYKRAGLDVTIVPGQGPAQALQGVESKTAQFALSDVANLVAARAGGASAKMVAVIEQKSPYAIFSLRSGANVSRPQQLESLEIGSAKGSAGRKVIEAFMTSTGLKPETVKYTDIDPAAAFDMLATGKVAAIETSATSMPAVMKAAGVQNAQIFLLANNGLALYGNGIVTREDFNKTNAAQVKAFVKASLEGWKDTVTNPREAADIVSRSVKGLDPDATFQEVAIVSGLVATPEARTKGLGLVDAKQMAAGVDLIAKGADSKAVYDLTALPQPPIKP